jgi:acyl carrier protein
MALATIPTRRGEVTVQEDLSATAVMEILREASAELEIDLAGAAPEVELRELGVDSLDQYELLTVLEDKTGLRIPDGKVNGIKTVNDLVECILQQQREDGGEQADRQDVSG